MKKGQSKRKIESCKPYKHPDLPDVWCIPLTKGQVTLVDSKYRHLGEQFLWYCHGNKSKVVYALRGLRVAGKTINIQLHRAIYEAEHGPIPNGLFIDHIDQNGLNNCVANLRLANSQENRRNTGAPKINKSSKYKGVSFEKRTGKYRAYIWINGGSKRLGSYDDPKDAAIVYDKAAIEAFGKFASLNFED